MKYILYTLTLLSLMSCEKVIQVDLNNSNPQYVIEAILQAGANDFNVKITQTTSFFDPKTPQRIENAVVKLIVENQEHLLIYVGEGNYELANFTAYAEKNYRLSVTVDGKSFNASLQMPKMVPIEGLDFELADGEDGFGYNMKVHFQDPANEDNYYELNSYQDRFGLEAKFGFITSDFGYDGRLITETLEGTYVSGDTVLVELRSVNVGYYDFFETLDNALGDGSGPGGAAPANPTTNWSNGALGYFGCGNSDIQKIVVP